MIATKINSISSAKRYIAYLFNNDILYHLDEDAFDVIFNALVTKQDREQMNFRNSEIDALQDFEKHAFCLKVLEQL